MLRPLHPDSFSSDPIVRQTIAKLRWSVVAVLVGTAASILLAAAVAHLGFRDGVNAAGGDPSRQATAKQAAPSTGRTSGTSSKGGSARSRKARQQRVRAARAKAQRQAAAREQAARERQARIDAGPTKVTLGVLALGFSSIGLFMFLVVRRPALSARQHAAELVAAYRTLQDSTLETFAALNATVEAKDRYTAGHGLRVTLISLLIAQEMHLRQSDIDTLRHAATFHDIGKIAVPDHVLQKPGRLTDQEFEAMKVHPVESARICSKLAVLRDAVPAIRGHHERMDGRGYPDGLVGDAIPLGARIIAVADAWDAITSDRPYRKGQPATVALDEIRRVSGSQFDPRVVRAFLEVLAKDPWMFGLTPEDVRRNPAAPGMEVEHPSRSSERGDGGALERIRSYEPEVDWSTGFDCDDDDQDVAA